MKMATLFKKIEANTGGELFYCDDSVHQILKRQKLTKYNILVRNMPIREIAHYLRDYIKKTKTKAIVEQHRNYLILHNKKIEIEIRLPIRGSNSDPFVSLKYDSNHQDFTINAMYLPITSRSKNKVIDFHGGLQDIKRRKIKTIREPKKFTKNDPRIMIKAIATAAMFNYNLDSNLAHGIKLNHGMINEVPIKILRKELISILLSDKPSKYLKMMYKMGLLNVLIPELSNCVGVNQNEKYHKYDVFTHSIIACDNVKPDIVLRLATLFHDVGKPQTMEIIENNDELRATFHRHEIVGSQLTKAILKRFGFDRKTIQKVSHLIYVHMYNYDPKAWTDSAVRRFIKRAKITKPDLKDLNNLPLFLIRKADRAANGMNLPAVSNLQIHFQKRIKKVYEKSTALSTKDLTINGDELKRIFNLKEGPTIGHVLNYLLRLVLEDQNINEKDKLIELASKYLSNALK